MKSVLFCFAFCAVLAAVFANLALDDKIIDQVNLGGASWKAGRNSRFEGMTFEDARMLLGTRRNGFARLPTKRSNIVRDPPASFDARTQWPGCVHDILDQAQCGSCWAFGATEALSDRFCIASKGSVNVTLSPQELVSCDKNNYGCQGGYLDKAWDFMKETGVPTLECMPYTSGGGVTGTCPPKCRDGSEPVFYKAKSVFSVKGEQHIQNELMENGPLEVAFDVYQDFFAYKSGVYVHKSGGLAGGHAVKLIGWGEESGVPYWLLANSWGTSWGMNGFFMIKRGSDECGIEDDVVGGLADVNSIGSDVTLDDALVLNDDMITAVNQMQSSWTAAHNERFRGKTVKDVKRMMGAKAPVNISMDIAVLRSNGIPDSFDSRNQWPSCIHAIRNQEQCGSCWAFGATEALSDRFCISKNINVVLSPEDLVSCDDTNDGCQGGQLQAAWEFMASQGVVDDSCFPYTAGSGIAPPCSNMCGSGTRYYVDASTIRTYQDEQSIQMAIMTSGPVEASFSVYQDFMSYSSGVYQHTSGSLLGGHAIKIIGWGNDNGTPYWIIANSWGTSWGLDGYFWMLRGVNECGIESNAVAGTPK